MSSFTRLTRLSIATFSAALATASLSPAATNDSPVRRKIIDADAVVPAREVQACALVGSSRANPLDVLVIGGGATGCGVALDAVTRGLRVGLVEREDFSSGTSSRSTKLIHGGVLIVGLCSI